MLKPIVSAIAIVATSSAAMATGDVYCKAVDGSDAEFGYGFGRVPGLVITSASFRAGDKRWQIHETQDALPIVVAQGAYDGPRTIIDFADPGFNEIVASVRIISAVEGDEYRSVGLLRIKNVGAYALICE